MVVATVEKDLSKIWEVKTLGKVQDAVARKLLEDAAMQVQPIMRKRKWQVPLLSEFCPRDPRLLGLNVDGGKKIMVRVRRSGNDSEFFPYESVLGTLLHELTHNECGPHDAKFYKLLDEITTECEQLMAKGVSGTGEGFDAPGQRLGGLQHNPPPTALRKSALAAAEKRARIGALMPSGTRRLGGDSSIMRDLSPVQAAAMAAERRQRDDVWCAAPVTSGHDGFEKVEQVVDAGPEVQPSASEEETQDVNMETRNLGATSMASAADESSRKGKGIASVQDVVEAQKSKVEGGFYPLGYLPEKSGWQGTCSTRSSSLPQERSPADDLPGTSQQWSDHMWECSICTLLNPPMAAVCGACGSGVNGQASQMWTCSKCTLRNCASLTSCEACGAPGWRHSTSFNPETAIIVRPSPGVTHSPAAAAVGASKASPLGDSRTWTCRQCTLENTVLLTSCEACDTWRFSHGPPVATRGPTGT